MNVKDEKRFEQALNVVSTRIKLILSSMPPEITENIQEIRLRNNAPVVIVSSAGNRFLQSNGKLTSVFSENCVKASPAELSDTVNRVCSFSLHTNQQSINNGFVTISGGHRVGLCGTAVYEENKIISIKDISSVNIRIAREILGVSSFITENLLSDGLKSIIIAGPPSSGKTTLLRDFARQLSSGYTGKYVKTAVIDERGEFGAVSNGIPQNDLGLNTDILSNYKKSDAAVLAIRSLSPEYIVFDEVSTEEDVTAIKSGLNCGVNFAVSVHASSITELKNKALMNELLKTRCFSYVILLKNSQKPCEAEEIYTPEVKNDEICWDNDDFLNLHSYGQNVEFKTASESQSD